MTLLSLYSYALLCRRIGAGESLKFRLERWARKSTMLQGGLPNRSVGDKTN